MTELDVPPSAPPTSKVCLVDLAKDESTSTDSSVSSSLPSETPLTVRPVATTAGDSDELNRCDYPTTPLTTTPKFSQGKMLPKQPRASPPSTPLYNAFSQHNYSPAPSQRRLSGIGISLSLEDLRNAINQEFPLLMQHEEKKQDDDDDELEGDSDLDPDERLALKAQRIRSEIRQSEMLELAVEAERAAEAGLESFMGRASTFGDDMAVMDTKTLKHPAALKRNSTYSEGFLRTRQMPRMRPKRKIRVLALRAVDEVIPPLGEIHSHLRTHLARNGVDEETLVFQENEMADLSERGSSTAFFKNLHNWVSQSSNLSTPPRFMSERLSERMSERLSERMSERDATSGRLSAIPSQLAIQLTPNSMVSEEGKYDQDDDSTDSSIVGDTLAGHIIANTGSPRFRPMSPEIKVPPGLEWSMVPILGHSEAVPDSISIFDAVPAPNLGNGPLFEENEFTDVNDPMTPLALFDAIEEGESDSVVNPNPGPLIPSNEMMTPDLVGRKTPEMDFQTPVRLRDIRDKGSDGSSCGLAMRNDNRRGVFSAFGRSLQPRKADLPLMPRAQSSPAYAGATFIAPQSETRLDAEPSQNSIPEHTNDIKLLYQPFMENDRNSPAADVEADHQQRSVDEQRSAVESVTIDTQTETQTARDKANENESLEDAILQVKKDPTAIFQNERTATPTVIVNRLEQREDSNFQVLPKDPSAEYSVVLFSTPDDSLLDIEIERDFEERVQPSPSVTTTSGHRTDEEGSVHQLNAFDMKQNLVAPATPPLRTGCECLVPLSRTDDFDARLKADGFQKEETSQEIRRVSSCPSLVDVIESEPNSPLSPKRGLTRNPSHRREKTVWLSLGLEDKVSPGASRRTRRSDSLQAAVDTMIAKLSPTTCGSPKYPYISHADNNDFLNNYLYCSKPMEQWNILDATASFDETTQSTSLQCVNFFFGSTCDGFTNLVTSLLPKRRSFDNRDVFTLNTEPYAEVDPDSWFNVAAERFDGALERLVGRARAHRKRFQAPSLRKKPPSVRLMASRPDDDELQEGHFNLIREKAPEELPKLERAPEPSLSDPQFRIIYGMSRERFQELNSVAQHFKDRFPPQYPEEESSGGVKRELFSPEHPEEEGNSKRDLVTNLSALTA